MTRVLVTMADALWLSDKFGWPMHTAGTLYRSVRTAD